MQKVKADDNHTDQFFQDYIDASKYADDAIAAETKEAKKANLQAIKDLSLIHIFDAIYTQTVEHVKRTNPFGVTFCQIVVHCYHVHAVTSQGIDEYR